MILRLLICLLVLHLSGVGSVWVFAAETLYVRPAGECTNNGDGTLYICASSGGAPGAFNELDNVAWGAGAGQLDAGDTIILCGDFTTTGWQQKRDGSAGNVITVDGDCSSQGRSSRAKITMTGNGSAYSALSTGWSIGGGATFDHYKYGTYQNLELIGYGTGAARIVNGAVTNPATVVNRTEPGYLTFDHLLIHDTSTLNAGHPCFRMVGSNITITNTTIYNCSDDGIYLEGQNDVIAYNSIHDVDQRTDTITGDCIQFGASASIVNTGHWIHHNTLDHSSKASKSALIIDTITTAGASFNIVEYNTLYGGDWGLSLGTGGIVRGNYIRAKDGGAGPRGISIQNTGDNTGAMVLYIFGNVIDARGIVSCITANIVGQTANPWVVYIHNNTCVDFKTIGFDIFGDQAFITAGFFNNVLYTSRASATFAIALESGSTNAGNDYNLWFGPAAKWTGAAQNPGTHDLNTNPLFLSSTDYRLQPTSLARNAGTIWWPGTTVTCTDFRGRQCNAPPDIGAYQATDGDLAKDRSLSTTRSTATTRSLATTRTLR